MKSLVYSSLNRNEQGILRLIATGVTKRLHFQDSDVAKLSELALVEEQNGGLSLTERGKLTLAEERKRLFQNVIMAARK
jgi:hypothetical protein